MEDRPVLLERLALIEKALDFALRFGPVVENQWATAQEQGYISGMGDDGTSFLMYLGAAEGGGAVGILFDWAELTTLVQEQVEGLVERDFALALFDADAEAAFATAHRETIYETGPASRWMDRIRLGIWRPILLPPPGTIARATGWWAAAFSPWPYPWFWVGL